MASKHKYYINIINVLVQTVPYTKGFGQTELDFLKYNFELKQWERCSKIDLSDFNEISNPLL